MTIIIIIVINSGSPESGIDNGGKSWVDVKLQRGIFKGDILFVIAIMPLNHIHRKCSGGYKLYKSQGKINHLMYMDDIKLFRKMKKNWKPKTGSEDIQSGKRDRIWHRKMSMLIMRSEKPHMTEGRELPSQEKIRILREKKTYKYLGILEAYTFKQVKMKEKIKKKSTSG